MGDFYSYIEHAFIDNRESCLQEGIVTVIGKNLVECVLENYSST